MGVVGAEKDSWESSPAREQRGLELSFEPNDSARCVWRLEYLGRVMTIPWDEYPVHRGVAEPQGSMENGIRKGGVGNGKIRRRKINEINDSING